MPIDPNIPDPSQNDPMAALNMGLATTLDPDPATAKVKVREEADVKKWMERLDNARKYDEPARRQYVTDRRYARGDTGAEVSANLVGTYIDILEAFLYAKDPDMDIRPGDTVQPPSMDTIKDAVGDMPDDSPEVQQLAEQMALAAVKTGVPPEVAMGGAVAAARKSIVNEQVDGLRKRYAKRQRETKDFAETAEIIGARMWWDASLKRRGRALVRSALTVGVGIIKASWQERTAPSPETTVAINDLQANIQRAKALQLQIADGTDPQDEDANIAELERQVQTLEGQAEQVMSRGYVIDFIAAEDFQIPPGYTIANHMDAPWNEHRIFMRYEDAQSEFGLDDETMRQAKIYSAREPVMILNEAALVGQKANAKDADAFVSSGGSDMQNGEGDGGKWVLLREIWNRDSNTVLTGISGVKRWVKPGWNPPATTRFYPFFLLTIGDLDAQRHPQSLTSRSAKLIDEYNRIGSAEAEHRRRVKPKTMFNAGMLSPADAKKLQNAVSVEMVPIKPTQPNTPLTSIMYPVVYPQMDPGLYSRQSIIGELERIWGVQEALSGAVNVAKTATESEIQQTGFQARSGSRRDALETLLSDLAQYSIEVARVFVDNEDAVAMAGPDAFWPPYEGPNDLVRMLDVTIKAGSSGKPDTSAERQAWSALLPILQAGIMQIGQLRQSTPEDIADKLENLMQITAQRSGDRIDIDDLVPQAGPPAPPMQGPPPGQPGQPGQPPQGGPMPPVEPPPGGEASADPLQQG